MTKTDVAKQCETVGSMAHGLANVSAIAQDQIVTALFEAAGEIRRLRLKLAHYAPPGDAPACDPQARLAFAVMRGVGRARREDEGLDEFRRARARAGDLVMVEVPPNMHVHDADAARIARILAAANVVGAHWREQDGVNGNELDELATATAPTIAPITEAP